MDVPNIFAIATKELSQDAFITWLLQWADELYQKKDRAGLHTIGQNFVKFLLGKVIDTNNIKITTVEAGRQWCNIDIWADINSEYFIIIEDKTNTYEHDEQLERYAALVEKEYGKTRKIICIYIKTELESLNRIKEIQKKGWAYCGRQELLGFLLSQNSVDNIFVDYVNYLKEKDELSNSFYQYSNLYTWESVKGLYINIQNKLNEWSDWDYVANPSGGFLGLWFHFTQCLSNHDREFYLQIENNCYDRCDLYIKICGDWNREVSYLYGKLEHLQNICKDFGLTISKPVRYRPGEYTSLAIINDVFLESNGKLDLDNLFKKFDEAMKLVNELAHNS